MGLESKSTTAKDLIEKIPKRNQDFFLKLKNFDHSDLKCNYPETTAYRNGMAELKESIINTL